jgi:A/G-specific adenine glycosylase
MTPPRARRRLLDWYRRGRRDLPWRRTRDPYAIWVSETMLQQTRSETVLRYWEPFLRRFPTVSALARAREASILARWSGLGYYARARNLHRAARDVVRLHGGRVPRDPAALAALPGLGRYTVGAVASIAFGAPLPVVDGNVARVLTRTHALDRPIHSGDPELWRLAASLVPADAAGDWNQALMELGATVCTPREPRCEECPLRLACVARRRGIAERLPRLPARKPARSVKRAVAAVESGGRFLLVRRDEGRLLRGLWEFPGVDVAPGGEPATKLRAELRRLGVRSDRLAEAGVVRHTILDRRIETRVYRGSAPRRPVAGGRWLTRERLGGVPLSAAGLRIARQLLGRGETQEA